ncbi:putative iron-regulated membrane protein [Sphingomonas sp. BE138]|uniref:PepSY-associated TM helix domain-containing protein n=1 Tax=Sphingomonas sp. BE138 TaxID=2817845 RepID=UPI00285C2E3D|nr:PepSY domain-containing protein [Sphingomonas sp. BE138]MDR6788168.1 putative iron-regulated membrane protein [Sphingomonas sp. BE138]
MSPSRPAAIAAELQRAVWRWHFFAGVLVLPFLLWLAVTGALYLYKPEIERHFYAEWIHVAPGKPTLPLETIASRVGAAVGGTVTQVQKPLILDESWRATVRRPDGTIRMAFVDPADGHVFGTTNPGGIMQTVKHLHSLALAGWVGNWMIEIAAGWSIVLVVSGLYLWWGRGRTVSVRGGAGGRLFWRDLHAVTGLFGGGLILFLAVSGMPWSAVWGKNIQAGVAGAGWGRPAVPSGDPHAGHDLPWSMEQHAMPMGGMRRVTADQALAAARAHGMAPDWTLTWPAAANAPYLVSATLGPAGAAHVVYVDAGSGRVVQDARFGDFGRPAQVIEWSAAVHQGKEYGEANRLVMLFACAALALLTITAPVMWWKRGPRGRTNLPDARTGAGLLAIMGVAGIVFPLTGLTMLAALAYGRGSAWARQASRARNSCPSSTT